MHEEMMNGEEEGEAGEKEEEGEKDDEEELELLVTPAREVGTTVQVLDYIILFIQGVH